MSTYIERLKQERDEEFVKRAVTVIKAGGDWGTFIDKHREYDLTPGDRSERCRQFVQMSNRYKSSKIGEWGLNSEMDIYRRELAERRQSEADEAWYRANREDLIKVAAERASWPEAKRRLGLTDLFEKDYRRAQDELGIKRSSERFDPMEQALLDGFFS